jgi:hypothetical protein
VACKHSRPEEVSERAGPVLGSYDLEVSAKEQQSSAAVGITALMGLFAPTHGAVAWEVMRPDRVDAWLDRFQVERG